MRGRVRILATGIHSSTSVSTRRGEGGEWDMATVLHYRLEYQEGQGEDIGNWNTLRYPWEHQKG